MIEPMHRFLLAAALVAGAGCQTPPEDACNRVRFGWPFFEIDPMVDTGDEEGIQLRFDVRSDLEGGVEANLFLRTEGTEEQTFVGAAMSDPDGLLSFANVSVPTGDILFILEARNDCGLQRTGRRAFVWDGLGIPQCSLSLATPPAIPEDGSPAILGPEHDEDPATEGVQVRVIVDAGRPDMEIDLFARDRERGEDTEVPLSLSGMGVGETVLTLPTGEHALRAVCYWEPEDLRSSTPTHVFLVEAP